MQRKLFIGCGLLLIISLTTQAQNTKYSTSDFIRLYGLKASFDLAKVKYKPNSDYYKRQRLAKLDMEAMLLLMPDNPFHIGGKDNDVEGGYVAPGNNKGYFNIRTGLRFNGRGEKQENEGDEYKMSLYYLTLPVYLQYNKLVNDNGLFFAGLGPYYGFALFGKFVDKIDGETFKENIKFGRDESGLRRGDFGLGFIAGYVYKRMLVQLSYDMGLTNINFESDFKAFNRAFGISVGYVLQK